MAALEIQSKVGYHRIHRVARSGTLAAQRCLYHLFTELVKVDKRNRSGDWKAFRKKLSKLMKDAIRLSEDKQISSERRERLKARLHARLDEMTSIDSRDKDANRLIKRLKRHKKELFTFLDHTDVLITIMPSNR